MFPPEPLVANIEGRSGAELARTRPILARRSAPLPASTGLALTETRLAAWREHQLDSRW
jgi:hypothetical protein